MQRNQQKSLKKNIEDRKATKKRMNIREESSLENSQQEGYIDGITKDIIGNIGIKWRKISKNERE